jgi:transcriptional regulator with XRE-family HTH domain
MSVAHVDIELVKQILRDATKDGAPFSQRGLSKAAGLNRDAVYDILIGRNRNPTIATLASIAEALGGDVSMFGLSKTFVVSEERLREELEDALQHMPKLEHRAGQAQYLAEAVAAALGLPKTAPEGDPAPPPKPGRPSKGSARGAPKA